MSDSLHVVCPHCAAVNRVPAERLRVAESGLYDAADVQRMRAAGADAILVGTSLMKAEDPGQALRGLLGDATCG